MANTTYDTIKNMKPAPWSRSTVADGNALNQNFLEPTHQKDLTLAAAIDQVKNTVDGYNETINTINGIANNAKELATEAISDVNEVLTTVEEHQEALSTLNYNVNSLSSSMVEVVTDITNLENNKQDKIYVDPTTIAGSGTQDSPYTVIGGGGGGSNKVYIPEVDESTGELSYVLSSTSGAQSPLGPWHVKPLIRIATESKEWEISYDGGITWENTHVNAEGIPGYSPTFEIENIPESQDPDALHKNGGTKITIKYGDGEYDTTSYSAWNGNDGSMANAPDIEGTNGLSASFNGSKYFVGLSGEMEVGKVYAVTTSGVEEMPIEYSADGRLCSIGEGNVFVYEDGGLNDVLLQGYANSGTYEDFAQGYENSAFQYSLVQGRSNNARMKSLAQGYHNSASGSSFAQGNENIAEKYALAQGYENSAVHHSLAQGYENTASNYSFAQGTDNIALSYSLSQGAGNRAETYSIAQGQGNRAFENSQAFGLSTIASGSSIDGHPYGMMSIGSYNATSAGALFVIGNGYSENSTEHRSDAFIVYKDGHVSAAGDVWANGVKLGSGGGTLSLPLNIYNTTANTATNNSIGALGNNCYVNTKSFALSITGASAYSNSFAFGDANYAANNSMAAGWKVSASNESFAAGQEVSANNRSIAIGHGNTASQTDATIADRFSIAIGDCVQAYDYSQAFGRGLIIHGNSNGKGCMAIGGWNSTTANALFVIGNGTGSTRSDAMVVDYTSNTTFNGSVSARVATGQNIIAVASAASLIGASRQTSANYGVNDTAMGTTWMGVGGPGMYRGFLKYTQGGNVGDLDSNNTMQVEFTPNNKGTIFAKAKNSGNDCPETQILNPTKASCDAMATSANANLVSGPNYMLAKNADGQFVIGAAFVNCTDINSVTLAPNTYYFVYEV